MVSIVLGFVYYEWRVSIIVFAGAAVYLFVVNHQMNVSRREAPKRQLSQMKLTLIQNGRFAHLVGVNADKSVKTQRNIQDKVSKFFIVL